MQIFYHYIMGTWVSTDFCYPWQFLENKTLTYQEKYAVIDIPILCYSGECYIVYHKMPKVCILIVEEEPDIVGAPTAKL